LRWILAVAVTFGLGACTSTGMSVGKSAGESAAGVSSWRGASCSMFPAFKPGDRLKFDSDVGELRRGDIVLYKANFAGTPPQQMVHRVVGLPGERLEPGAGGGILVNGAPLVEDYLPAGTSTYLREPVDIPADHWFVMGDNRERSSDSRVTGPIPRAGILSRLTKVDPVKPDEDNDCGAPVEPPGSSLSVDDDPPAVQLVTLPVVIQQAVNQHVTADNLDAIRAEVLAHTDDLETLLTEVGKPDRKAAHAVLRDEAIPALRVLIVAATPDEWTARRAALAAAMTHYLQAIQTEVLGE
jgi:signal peptidase I